MRKFVLLLIVAMLSFCFVSQAKAVDSMGADEDQVTANQMADYKEDVNKAIADLNSKIQAVDAPGQRLLYIISLLFIVFILITKRV